MNLWYKRNFLAILFLVILSSFALKDLTKPGLYTSHDGETHTARVAQYYQALKDGQIPPRFAGSFYNNFGSPIFVYIYPIPYLLGSILYLIGFSFADSFKTLMSMGFVFSGVFTYFWLKELTSSTQAGFLGALYYMYSPYRLQLIYVRGSISELVAYTFVPLALYFVTRLSKYRTTKLLAANSIAISIILLSQNLVALLTLPVLLGYAFFFAYIDRSKQILVSTIISIFWAVSIASFTYFPAIFERSYIKFDEVFKLVFSSHFVTIKQLFRSPWGYGFDLPGTVNDQMSFQLGLAHLMVLLFGVILLILPLIKKTPKSHTKDKIFYKLAVISYISVGICVFLVTELEVTKFIWRYVTILQIIDIPWRILGLVPIFAALIVALFTTRFRSGIVFLLFLFSVIFANRNHIRINKSLAITDDAFLKYTGTATQLSEFTPESRRSLSSPDFTDQELLMNTAGGWAKYSNVKTSSRKITFDVDIISENAQIRINKFDFPGVQVKAYNDFTNSSASVDYKNYSTGRIRLDTFKDTNGFIFFPLEMGNYHIEVIFGETPLRNIANLLSLFSAGVATYFLFKNEYKF